MNSTSHDGDLAAPDIGSTSPPPVSLPPPLAFDQHDTPAALVVTVRGEVDLTTIDIFEPAMGAALDTALRAGRPLFVVDLDQVGFLGSTGVAALLDLSRRARRQNCRTRVVARPDSRAGRVLDMLNVAQHLAVHDDLAHALAPDPGPR